MAAVPNFALYGTEAQPSWIDLVHFERIPVRSAPFNWDIHPHTHDALIQVLHPVSGSGEIFIDDRKWMLRPPCLIVAPARAVHGFRFSPDTDGAVITAPQRSLESLAGVAAPELLRYIRTPVVLEVDPASHHAEALVALLAAIERESNTHAEGRITAGVPLLVALFVQIARISQNVRSAAGVARSRKAVQVERFRALLDERWRTRLSVEGYAKELGVTAGQLTRLCREVMGMSTLQAINARVVYEAQRELVYSALSIKQVAAELGFEDEAYFGRLFKKQTGLRPTEFREMVRRQLNGTQA